MCRVRCEPVTDGPGPNEQIVNVVTASGVREEVIAPNAAVRGDTLQTSHALEMRDDGAVLVELPRESSSGAWRVWVAGNAVVEP